MKLTNPFWKDVLSSYHFAKPYTKMNTNEQLPLAFLSKKLKFFHRHSFED
jgi:hypothetical protein